jgi:hypothetical protein
MDAKIESLPEEILHLHVLRERNYKFFINSFNSLWIHFMTLGYLQGPRANIDVLYVMGVRE